MDLLCGWDLRRRDPKTGSSWTECIMRRSELQWGIISRKFHQKQLDTLGRRATPRQWGYYTTASTTANILRNREPSLLFDLVQGNMTSNRRRPARPSFFDTTRRKIGRQSLQNRIGETFKRVEADWMEARRSKAAVRIDLKRAFFPYFVTETQTT